MTPGVPTEESADDPLESQQVKPAEVLRPTEMSDPKTVTQKEATRVIN